jgi:hypothetical protein
VNTLTLLGIASLAFVVVFTARAYRNDTGEGQTPRGAIVEAWTNIVIGFSVNMLANVFLIPLMTDGGHVTFESNWWGGWVYTAISVIRQYAIRRWNNRLQYVGLTTKSST